MRLQTRKANKYHARKTVVDGITFDSKKEAWRYRQLRLLEKAGKIRHLEMQPKYELLAASPDGYVAAKKVGVYRADFAYYDVDKQRPVTEDVKGIRTAVYKLKKKMVEATYGITITEVE